jgi:RNA polymerase sigma-70 factor (ECF subfamily)
LKENDWHKLHQFNYNSKLTTWIYIVAFNFSLKRKGNLINNESSQHLITEQIAEINDRYLELLEDMKNLLSRLKNKQYRDVITNLLIEDRDPKEVAAKMGISDDNLRQIKGRALKKLKQIAEQEKNSDSKIYNAIN